MKIQHLFILLFCFASTAKANWQRPILNFSRNDYQAATQNWDIVQSDNGWIYAANNKGLLEYDGLSWHTYPIHNAKTRSLHFGSDGRMYVGGMGQFGYFAPNNLGGLDYTCLSKKISSVGVIWNVCQYQNKIYFISDKKIYAYDHHKITQIQSPEIICSTHIHNKRLYVLTTKNLYVFNGSTFQKLHSIEGYGKQIHHGGLQSFDGKILLITRDKGVFSFDGRAFKKMPIKSDSFCQTNHLFCAALCDGMLALGSVQGGVLLANLRTNEMEIISSGNGLQNNTILSLSFDKNKDLWAGLDNGIDCICMNNPIASLYGNKSVIGSGYASCRYNGKLYLATNRGLYETQIPTKTSAAIEMKTFTEISGQVWSLTVHESQLFCCSDNGLYVFDKGKFTLIAGVSGVWRVVALDANRMIAGTYDGLFLIEKTGNSWQLKRKIDGFRQSCKNMLVEDKCHLWVANKENGVSRLVLSADFCNVTAVKNYNDKLFPKGYDACIAKVNDRILVTSHHGMLQYDSKVNRLKHCQWLESMLKGNMVYTYIYQDENRNIWCVADGSVKLIVYDLLEKKHSFRGGHSYLKGFLMDNFENITSYHDEHGVLVGIVSTEDGFSLLNPQKRVLYAPYMLSIRRVFATESRDSIIYGRSYRYDNVPVTLPFSCNSIRIEYGINMHGQSVLPLYSYSLSRNGEAEPWSSYSENNQKEFTNLEEGAYVFRVKMMTDSSVKEAVTSFAFYVLPPWYRSWWSYLIYFALLVASFYLLYIQVIKSRKRLIMEKELEYFHEQQALRQENNLKDKKIDSLMEENLKEELRHKSDELIQTTLNIVRKNEMLLSIKKEVVGISHSIVEENLVSIRRKTFRLLGQIETNMEHDDDLKNFQSTFDFVHHDFFQCLDRNFPNLSNKDKQLCAYIKMDLLSKEIAPLMNISLRGVEISRYRLRKKLNVSEGVSLTAFLSEITQKQDT